MRITVAPFMKDPHVAVAAERRPDAVSTSVQGPTLVPRAIHEQPRAYAQPAILFFWWIHTREGALKARLGILSLF